MEQGPTDDASRRLPDGGAVSPGVGAPADASADRDLASVLAEFVTARAELVRWEARAVARQAARKGTTAAVALAAAGFAWALLLAGVLGWAAGVGWPWHWIALAAASLHLLVVLILGICLGRPSPPVFPLTCRELEKDRAWLAQLKQDLKSRG
jgi:MFS family permease